MGEVLSGYRGWACNCRYVWEDVEVSLQDEGVGVGVGGVEGGNRVVE